MIIVLQRVPTQLAIKVVKKIGVKIIKTTTKSSIQVPATKGKLKLDYRMYVAVFGSAVVGEGVSTQFKQYQEKYL